MKNITTAAIGLIAMGFTFTASAAGDVTSMVGKCDATEVCAKVIAGPKNVGLQMIKSKLEAKGDGFVGKVAHPQTGDTYNAKLNMADANTWHLDGCTDKNVCASGDFKRIQ
jgi:uncharacterized protein (DUF2147 family)